MTERLTTRYNGIIVKQHNIADIQVIDKLGKLEDILEKYGIESVESLQELLQCLNSYFINSADSFKIKFEKLEKDIKYFANRNGKHYEELCEAKHDRDTWKKACELACEQGYKNSDIGGQWFGACNRDNIDNFNKLTDKEKNNDMILKLNCDYFYQQAQKENKQ